MMQSFEWLICWKAVEGYYANSLRDLKKALKGEKDFELDEDEDDAGTHASIERKAKGN